MQKIFSGKPYCKVIELVMRSLPETIEWMNELQARQDEVIQTLKEEGISVESVFHWQHEERDYLIYYIRTCDFEKATEVTKNSTHSIDTKHQEWKKNYWKKRFNTTLLLDVNVFE